MALIKGIKVVLYEEQETGRDGFNRPVYDKIPTEIENVLVSPVSGGEVLDTLNLTGRKAVYQLAIPKGDQHDWIDKEVSFWGRRYHTIGDVIQGIDALIPLDWNKKVLVEAINGEGTA